MTEEQFKKILQEQTRTLTRYVDERLNDQAHVLTRHIDQRIKEVQARLSVQDRRIDKIYKLLDNEANQAANDEQERAAMNAQLTRHEDWINQIADHTGVELAPEQ
jgi:hypothetical protein